MNRIWDKSRPVNGPFALNRDCPQAQGLMMWYPMGAGSGRNYAVDLAGSTHISGTASSMTLLRNGEPAITFNGSSDKLDVAQSLITASPISLHCFATVSSPATTQCIFGVGSSSAQNELASLLVVASKPWALTQQGSGGNKQSQGATTIVANTQYGFGGIFASTTSRIVYLNGVADAAADTFPVTPTSINLIRFGQRANNSDLQNFGGSLGEVAVWNIAVAADVFKRINDPSTRFELWYPLRSKKWISIAAGGSSGTVAYTNANDTSAASGTTTVVGTLAKTNANDTSAASGTTKVLGTLAKTNANDTCAASGTVGSSGSSGTVAYTNANDTVSAAGTTTVVGTLARTNANDSVSAAGWAGLISGTLAYTNANDTVSASGSGGTAVATAQQGGGRSRKKYNRPVVVEIDGEDFIVHSEDEAVELLDQAKTAAEKRAKVALKRATTAKKRKTGQIIRDARKTLTPPVINAPGLDEYVSTILSQIRDTYQSTMQSIEISALLRKREREEEDDEDVLMLIA